jgi:alpha-methylacyl-CoA racemase
MGVLSGIRVIEMAGIGPCPFAGMLLADMGADVIRIDRRDGGTSTFGVASETDVLSRGRRSVALDLKQPAAIETVLQLCTKADALIEGFRPGVMERLGLGPESCLARNAALVYGRVTGWGQQGPLASTAGHDINYLALSGALHSIGERNQPPIPPINLVGDYGGGAMLLLVGLLGAMLEARRSGTGQVVDAAMVDGAAQLMAPFYGLKAVGLWQDQRSSNLLDGGAYFYRCYETADGGYLSIGPLEPKFFAEFLRRAGLNPTEWSQSPDQWQSLTEKLAVVIRTRSRDEWMKCFEGSDACVAPVLSLGEAPTHPHNLQRGGFVEVFGVTQPTPAPRFSKTPSSLHPPPRRIGVDTRSALADWGLASDDIENLSRCGAIA